MNNNKFKQTVKRIISGFVAAATAITVFPAHFAMAEEVGRFHIHSLQLQAKKVRLQLTPVTSA